MRCPKCHLINDDSSIWCDCGHSFVAEHGGRPKRRRRHHFVQAAIGCIVLVFVGVLFNYADRYYYVGPDDTTPDPMPIPSFFVGVIPFLLLVIWAGFVVVREIATSSLDVRDRITQR
jgi:hypothetical protein